MNYSMLKLSWWKELIQVFAPVLLDWIKDKLTKKPNDTKPEANEVHGNGDTSDKQSS